MAQKSLIAEHLEIEEVDQADIVVATYVVTGQTAAQGRIDVIVCT